jgi:hypothetical protein
MDQNQELSYDDANNLLQHRFLCVYGTMALIEQYYADARAAGYGADDPPLSSHSKLEIFDTVMMVGQFRQEFLCSVCRPRSLGLQSVERI